MSIDTVPGALPALYVGTVVKYLVGDVPQPTCSSEPGVICGKPVAPSVAVSVPPAGKSTQDWGSAIRLAPHYRKSTQFHGLDVNNNEAHNRIDFHGLSV